MKNTQNSVQIIGNVGKTPEVRELAGGNMVARFRVATHEKVKLGDGTKKSTQWHSVVAWGEHAKYIEKNLTKGARVALEGKLTNRTWEDQEGKKHTVTEIKLNEIMLTETKSVKGQPK